MKQKSIVLIAGLALSLMGLATSANTAQAQETEVVSYDSGRDKITITVIRGGAPDLANTPFAALEFESAEPSQDRTLHEVTTWPFGAHLRCFRCSGSVGGQVLLLWGPKQLLFQGTYASIFGTYYMHNSQGNLWASPLVRGGDKVIVRWGP